MIKILLSVKPEFANKIFDGTKLFEFRKVLFQRLDISNVIVYVSSPVQRVLGEFTIDSVVSGPLSTVWKQTSSSSGISYDFFMTYFSGRKTAYAIRIGKVIKYKEPKTLDHYAVEHAPQSFVYVEDSGE